MSSERYYLIYFHSKFYLFCRGGLKHAIFIRLSCMNLIAPGMVNNCTGIFLSNSSILYKSYILACICFQISSYILPGLL